MRYTSVNEESQGKRNTIATQLREQEVPIRVQEYGLRSEVEEEKETKASEDMYPVYDVLQTTGTTEEQISVTPEELERLSFIMSSNQPLGSLADSDAVAEDKTELTGNSLFTDQEQWDNAPHIRVLAESNKIKYRMIVLQHERYYRANPTKLYVPRLKPASRLSVTEFAKEFLFKSQPVVIPFEAMRHLNFTTKHYSLDQLLEMYPNRKPALYKYGLNLNKEEEIDFGPAIHVLSQDSNLKKTKQGRNFPRNMKVNLESVKMLDVQFPPYVLPGTKMMAPSVWFGATSSSTKTHSDCCDNFAMMISGTKRWTIAPPSEARVIKPKCNGGLCWGNRLAHADEHATSQQMRKLRDQTQLITFDLHAGEVLYLPCGWFHHVENVGPTIMVNFWTKEKPFFLQKLDGDINV